MASRGGAAGLPPGWSLVGRAELLAALVDDLGAAVEGRGQVVVLTGEPGIGKTAVAQAVADLATDRGYAIRWGRCWKGDSAPGFWPWQRVVTDLPQAVGALQPSAGGADGQALGVERAPDRGEFTVFQAVAEALEEAADAVPQLVVLDDLQWGDRGCLRLLGFVAAQLRRSRVLVLATCRPDTDGRLPDLPDGARTVSVAPLSAAQTAALATALGGRALSAAESADVVDGTGGNPFLVEQLVRLAVGSGAGLRAAAGDIVARRMSRLPQGCADLLSTAATVGRSCDLALLAAAAGLAPSQVPDVLSPAVLEGIVSTATAGVLTFTHDLFREERYDALAPVERARRHLTVAGVLASRLSRTGSPSAAEVAHHLGLAQPLSRPELLVQYAAAATGEAMAVRAFDEAARHARAALTVAEQSAVGDLGQLRIALGDALLRCGDRQGALTQFSLVVDGAPLGAPAGDPGDRAAAVARAALGLHRVGLTSGASHALITGALEQAIAALDGTAGDPDGVASSGRARSAVELAALTRAALARELADGPGQDVQRAMELADQGVDLAARLGDPSCVAFCLYAKHDVVWGPGTAGARVALAEQMAQAARDGGATDLLFEAALCRFVALVELGDPAAAAALVDVERLADQTRVPRARYLALSRRTAWQLLTGDDEAADRTMAEARELGERIDEPDTVGVWRTQQVSGVLVREGPDGLGRELARTGGPLLPPDLEDRERAFGYVASGSFGPVAALLRGAGPAAFRWRALGALAFDVELAAVAGVYDVLEDRVSRLLPYQDDVVVIGGTVVAIGPVALYLGVASAALGRLDAAERHLRAGLDVSARLDARRWAARCRVELADVLLRRGGPRPRTSEVTQAAALLHAATRDLDGVAAPYLTERIAAVGQRSGRLGTFRRGDDADPRWILGFGGRSVRLADAKGLHDLSALLGHPGQPVQAVALARGEPGPASGGADLVLDERARQEFRRRLEQLACSEDEAAADGDLSRLEAVRDEKEALLHELSAAAGLAGRPRRLGDEAERARTTVTARIRDTLRRIDAVHPELAAHLRASVHTGRSCVYEPVEPVTWQLGTVPSHGV